MPDETTLYHRDQKHQVKDVATVAEFLDRYYKPERYTGRGEDYAAGLLASYEERVAEDGYCFISRHDSLSGRVVAFYPPAERENQCQTTL